MSDIITREPSSSLLALPASGVSLSFRKGDDGDFDFIESLQKRYNNELGFFRKSWIEGYLKKGWVLIACDAQTGERVGFCAYRDRYQKRDELGIIYMLCVAPTVQRKFVGAAILKEVFERSPYGCRMYCCWCAQDLAANRFWESMGFVAVAFRTGSRTRGRKIADANTGGRSGNRKSKIENRQSARVHLFWQKRIRAGDTATPWWFPSMTSGGALGEERLVLPIPPGVHWSEAKPIVLPGEDAGSEQSAVGGEGEVAALPPTEARRPRTRRPKAEPAEPAAPVKPVRRPATLSFAPVVEVVEAVEPAKAKKVREKKPKAKFDPRYVEAARELRDRWLDEVTAGRLLLEATAKYDVARPMLTGETTIEVGSIKRIEWKAA
jgi:ribosomal protein S18 acetylase RimI-like enzyme